MRKPAKRAVTSANQPSPAADVELASVFRISVMRLARRLRAERLDETISLTELAALATVLYHGPLSAAELAAHERVQPPSMTRVVATLERRGLVRKSTHPTDRRVSVITGTEKGRQLIAEDSKSREAWLSRVLQTFTAEERELIRSVGPLLERIAKAQMSS